MRVLATCIAFRRSERLPGGEIAGQRGNLLREFNEESSRAASHPSIPGGARSSDALAIAAWMSAFARVLCAAAALTCIVAPSASPASSPATRKVVVQYRSSEQLAALERSGAASRAHAARPAQRRRRDEPLARRPTAGSQAGPGRRRAGPGGDVSARDRLGVAVGGTRASARCLTGCCARRRA